MHYDPESNILRVDIAKGTVDYVIEAGNFLIHVNKRRAPLFIEILDGGSFIGQLQRINPDALLASANAS